MCQSKYNYKSGSDINFTKLIADCLLVRFYYFNMFFNRP